MKKTVDYKVGDTVWYIPEGYGILIKCKIVEVDDHFRKQEPQAYLFYDIDEPVGHFLNDYELYQTKEDALVDFIPDPSMSLAKYRICRIHFIISTWELDKEKSRLAKRELYHSYHNKVYNEDWFNTL